MLIQDLKYSLVPENVVGTPREIRLGRRDLARMLVVDRSRQSSADHSVMDLPTLLSPGDVVVLNNSKRIPGVLHGRTALGGKAELRFVDLGETGFGLCRVFPMHDVQEGSRITLRGGGAVEIMEMGVTKYGLARVKPYGAGQKSLREILREQGTPILGFFYDGLWKSEQLNPFYASEEGSVESPLAGLHFTPELVQELENANIQVQFVTLHSVGSWLPFMEERADEHEMWAESFSVSSETARAINDAKERGNRIVACGSTSLRALESAVDESGKAKAARGRTSLYASPGFQFQIVDAYFTNFHQQQTSLIVLDCAFASQSLVMQSYREASERGYGFYEFGDAVLYL